MVNAKPSKKKKLKPLSAFGVLFIIITIMAGLTWVIPSGQYDMIPDPNDSSKEIRKAGSYKQVDKVIVEKNEETGEETVSDSRQGIWDVFMSPIKGMSEKLDVIVFVLILGGFLGITMKTGAIDAAIGRLLKKTKGKEKWVIPILMTLFAIGGTTYGMQEEAVAFYALVVPIMLAAGYNAMTAVMVIVLGGGVGVLASTVNPFSTGVAARAAEIQLGNILGVQFIILVAMLLAAIIFTMRYASKVKAGHYAEDTIAEPAVKALDATNIPKYTPARKGVMTVFALTFVIMILSLIPWGDFDINIFGNFHNFVVSIPVLGTIFGAGHTFALGAWYFNEISALFLVSTLIIALVYRKEFSKEKVSLTNTFLAGVGDLLGVALIIAVAAAVSVVMQSGGIQDTIIHWGEEGLKNVSSGVVGVLAYLFYLPMSFIIPSSSGLATASMPIIAPVADLVGSSKEVMVVAFANASGILNMMAPTIASLMAGLSLAGVSYKTWLKRTAPIMVIFMIISVIAIFAMGMA